MTKPIKRDDAARERPYRLTEGDLCYVNAQLEKYWTLDEKTRRVRPPAAIDKRHKTDWCRLIKAKYNDWVCEAVALDLQNCCLDFSHPSVDPLSKTFAQTFDPSNGV